EEMGIAPDEPQGAVVSQARERGREYLRRAESFVWNATNLSRQIREACISLFAAYGARIRIVHVEAPPSKLYERNRERSSVVPEGVIHRLLDRWEVPDLTEAHQVDWVQID
ncbi:MAG: AAA family ATPase, partial [Blastocatellia bacterium]